MNIIASRDQFKPIRIGENLVVNYNVGYIVSYDFEDDLWEELLRLMPLDFVVFINSV